MAAKKKSTRNGVGERNAEPLRLSWALAELPSSQHRAGLAGLVLAVRYLERLGSHKGTCTIDELASHSLTLTIDEPGLDAVFELIYAASLDESEEPQPRKNKNDVTVAPIRIEERKEVNAKGKETTKKVYIYPRVVPKGDLVLAMDPTRAGDDGVWTKLWRDFIWNIMRGVPAQREPFESRAERAPPGETTDSKCVIASLRSGLDNSVKLPSTYFLGAQERTADDVSFQDRARFQFLLHFWPLVASIYVPQLEDREQKKKFFGYAVAVPDVADLAAFVDELPPTLTTRGAERVGYRPRDAVVALPAEGALVIMDMLQTRLRAIEGAKTVGDVLLAVDVFHSDKQGNSIRLLSSSRIEPESVLGGEYARIRNVLWNLPFRRRRVLNLLGKRPWYHGFDELFAELPLEHFVARKGTFAHDVRIQFDLVSKPTCGDVMNAEDSAPSLEAIVLNIVANYLSRKLKLKHDLEWRTAKDDEGSRKEYADEKERLAKNAFLAVRGRTGQDFVDYFAGTICSVAHHLSSGEFVAISRALREQTADVRTLTMLALSARG